MSTEHIEESHIYTFFGVCVCVRVCLLTLRNVFVIIRCPWCGYIVRLFVYMTLTLSETNNTNTTTRSTCCPQSSSRAETTHTHTHTQPVRGQVRVQSQQPTNTSENCSAFHVRRAQCCTKDTHLIHKLILETPVRRHNCVIESARGRSPTCIWL